MSAPALHPTAVAMVSLAAGIAANHPAMGQCQLARLRKAGVPQAQIDTVIEIARHIREEAGEKLDAAFDLASEGAADGGAEQGATCGCGTTESGVGCC